MIKVKCNFCNQENIILPKEIEGYISKYPAITLYDSVKFLKLKYDKNKAIELLELEIYKLKNPRAND